MQAAGPYDARNFAALQFRASAKSRRAYQDFLPLWKGADSDIPVLAAAKAEYAKL